MSQLSQLFLSNRMTVSYQHVKELKESYINKTERWLMYLAISTRVLIFSWKKVNSAKRMHLAACVEISQEDLNEMLQLLLHVVYH